MFNLFFKKVTDAELADVRKRMEVLEQYLGVEYFNGPKYKAHYKRRRSKRSKSVISNDTNNAQT